MLSKNMNIGAGSLVMLLASIKNCMSVATTVYAADNMVRMLMDMLPDEAKYEYIDLILEHTCETANYGIHEISKIVGLVQNYFDQ